MLSSWEQQPKLRLDAVGDIGGRQGESIQCFTGSQKTAMNYQEQFRRLCACWEACYIICHWPPVQENYKSLESYFLIRMSFTWLKTKAGRVERIWQRQWWKSTQISCKYFVLYFLWVSWVLVSKILHGIVLQHVVSATANTASDQVGLISRSFSSLIICTSNWNNT